MSSYQPSVFKIAKPSCHCQWPDAALICPALPIFTNSLPQLLAKNFALSSETHGSSVLATTIVLKSILFKGIGVNPVAGKVYTGFSTSLGATKSAPLIFLLHCNAHWAIV